MKIHLVGGFLGSGKTTAIQYATRVLLKKNVKPGVITNDQGTKLVDGNYFENLGVPGRQVVNGCFCCNYNELETNISSLEALHHTEIIFAESVGSCTDIVATVLKPLSQFQPGSKITVSVFADVRLLHLVLQDGKSIFDEAVNYIYLKQLEEAGIIVINKIDLLNEQELKEIKMLMKERYGNKILLYQDSFNEDDILQSLITLDEYYSAPGLRSLTIDYDTYPAGEASLGWLDQELEIFSADNNAMQIAGDLINNIYKKIVELGYPIGHLKFLINGSMKISFTSNEEPVVCVGAKPGASASLLINIRIQAIPTSIEQLVISATREVENASGCKVVQYSLSAFQPGYPRPTHRI